MSLKTIRPFHPLIFGLLAILAPYVTQIHLFLGVTIVPSLLVVVFWVLLAWMVLSWWLGGRRQAGPIVSFLIIIFFSYPFFLLALQWILPSGPTLVRPAASLTTFALMLAALVFWFTGKRDDYDSSLLDNLSLVVLASVLFIWVKYELTTALHPEFKELPNGASQISLQGQLPPDIYYMILDGYARADTLRDLYKYDNSEFLSQLEDLGFWVADESRSNYTQTGLSLASSLNFDYLTNLASDLDPESDDRRPLSHLMRDNRIHKLLKGVGYTTVHLSTGYWPVDESKADVVFKAFWPYQGFSRFIFERTPIPSLLVCLGLRKGGHETRLFTQLNNLTALDSSTPTFVLAHYMCPHPPFVLGEVRGNPNIARSINDGADMVGEGLLTREEYVWNYREQVRIFSQMVLEKIELILKDSQRPKIIILQGDHGPASLLGARVPSRESLDERHSILNAYLFPGENDQLYPSISPVNTFRILLNSYFGTRLPLLEDMSLYSIYKRPYDLKNSAEVEADQARLKP
jgi:hypothetical protein